MRARLDRLHRLHPVGALRSRSKKGRKAKVAYKAGIAGVSGYAGGEILRLLACHPYLEIAWVGGEASTGTTLAELHPWLHESLDDRGLPRMKVQGVSESLDLSGLDLLFTCLPAGESSRYLAKLGAKTPDRIVDVGPDFRLPEETHLLWYGFSRPEEAGTGEWVYGFTEAYRSVISAAKRVANPGCYAYAALLALYPLAKEKVIRGEIFIDGKSGLSGAGRGAEKRLLLSEATENTVAYAVEGHRHQPEIEMVLEDLCGATMVVFVPHLVPMARGLMVTAYVPLSPDIGAETVSAIYSEIYAGEPFVAMTSAPPNTKAVRGSNMAAIHVAVRQRGNEGFKVAVATVAIDNLGKGAAGSAIHNANVMLGLDETAGLSSWGLWP
ncbi:MAG: N-acetyl-gamma-glutamyl-phosphate reductase [Acidimicrobiia bacterium]